MGGDAHAQRLVLVGTSHHVAPLEVRERLYLGPQETRALAPWLTDGGEAVMLSTCNRTEIYIGSGDPRAAHARVVAELARRSGLAEAELAPALRVATEDGASLHLFRVAAGLESLVPGEPQILGQLREAHERAKAAGTAGPLLDRLFRQALHAGKRVRSETTLGARPVSIAAAAAQLVREVFGGLEGRRILIIGAGKMSELAAASLVSSGSDNVFVANRTVERAAALAARFGGYAVGFDRLVAELERVDVVVSSTRCPQIVLAASQVAEALPRRRGRPLLLIDIAVPRDLDPAIGELPTCHLYDLDDLGRATPEADPATRAGLARAEAIVVEEAARFAGWRSSLEVVPTIVSLRRRAEAIRAAELARADGKLAALSSAERRAVEAVTAQIVNKLLHAPTVRAKEAAEGPDGGRYEAALRHLFALEEVA